MLQIRVLRFRLYKTKILLFAQNDYLRFLCIRQGIEGIDPVEPIVRTTNPVGTIIEKDPYAFSSAHLIYDFNPCSNVTVC